MPLGLEMLGRAVMQRARRGLYAGRNVKFGNKVSEDGGNKSRRMWRPNTQYKRLFSHILDECIRVRVTTHALRCIDKAGGIDEYLLKTSDKDLESDFGLKWKRILESHLAARQQANLDAQRQQGQAQPSVIASAPEQSVVTPQ